MAAVVNEHLLRTAVLKYVICDNGGFQILYHNCKFWRGFPCVVVIRTCTEGVSGYDCIESTIQDQVRIVIAFTANAAAVEYVSRNGNCVIVGNPTMTTGNTGNRGAKIAVEAAVGNLPLFRSCQQKSSQPVPLHTTASNKHCGIWREVLAGANAPFPVTGEPVIQYKTIHALGKQTVAAGFDLTVMDTVAPDVLIVDAITGAVSGFAVIQGGDILLVGTGFAAHSLPVEIKAMDVFALIIAVHRNTGNTAAESIG